MYNLSSFHFFDRFHFAEGLSSRDNPRAPIASADAKRRTAYLYFANPMFERVWFRLSSINLFRERRGDYDAPLQSHQDA
jgi:hypothetical protein